MFTNNVKTRTKLNRNRDKRNISMTMVTDSLMKSQRKDETWVKD